ncbi:3-keto-5-aminohexanoate cleavage protein [Actinocatenispora sera]|uniref:Uncharacterized protein n=1 Tax=Actinocatenispora sera TaxID=390989 RepID=A0A810L7C9_9ACTN|nr:3-keto-5-aminohexanoate cleavage protein [Actinocatenispora sera]BCJ30211.1 hypothetical protein Asera_43190 [Actinocatenispora sera]
MLQVCLNGAHNRDECPALPITPAERARAARGAVAAGARVVVADPGAQRFRTRTGRLPVLRIPAEVTDTDPDSAAGTAVRLLDEIAGSRFPVLPGEDGGAWPVLRLALRRGLDTRIGLEDTLRLPDGSIAADNAALVRVAVATG